MTSFGSRNFLRGGCFSTSSVGALIEAILSFFALGAGSYAGPVVVWAGEFYKVAHWLEGDDLALFNKRARGEKSHGETL